MIIYKVFTYVSQLGCKHMSRKDTYHNGQDIRSRKDGYRYADIFIFNFEIGKFKQKKKQRVYDQILKSIDKAECDLLTDILLYTPTVIETITINNAVYISLISI